MNFNDQKIDVPTKEKYVSLVNVNKVYDGNVHAVIDFNLDIKDENFRQTLELHLETQTKDNIVNIIKELEKVMSDENK